jgi:hypothetical protein
MYTFPFLGHRRDVYWTWLWVIRRVHYKKWGLLTIREHLGSPRFSYGFYIALTSFEFSDFFFVFVGGGGGGGVVFILYLVPSVTRVSVLFIHDCPPVFSNNYSVYTYCMLIQAKQIKWFSIIWWKSSVHIAKTM